MFCPKCGSILMPRKEEKLLTCSCGYKTSKMEGAVLKEKMAKSKEIEVVDKNIETLPKTNVECPKCHHREAFFWEVQTRAADEPATKFLRCEKCGHTWRDYN